MTLSETMSAFVAGLAIDTVPATALDSARDRTLDAISTAVGGRDMPVTRAAQASVEAGGASGACVVFPSGGLAAPQDAAFINGTAIHSLLFEDYHPGAGSHPGAAVVPAALAATQSAARLRGRPGTVGDLLLAVLAGYEITVRLGLMTAARLLHRGLRSTPIIGTVGAAAAAASAIGLPAERTAAALSMGANMACGFLEGFGEGTMEPYLHGGIAARNGLQAAWMGYGGVQAASTTFEGKAGYFAVFGDGDLDNEYTDEWTIGRVIAKTYPASGGKTNLMDSVVTLSKQGVDPADIVSVIVREPASSKTFPGSDNKGPFHNMYEAQDSTQFLVAAGLLGRPLTSLDTMRNFRDPEVLDLAQRVETIGEEGRYATGAAVCAVEVTLRDGTVLVREEDNPDAHLPTVERMAAKVRTLTTGIWAPEQAERVIAAIVGDPETPITDFADALQGR